MKKGWSFSCMGVAMFLTFVIASLEINLVSGIVLFPCLTLTLMAPVRNPAAIRLPSLLNWQQRS